MATGGVYLEGESVRLGITLDVEGVRTDPTTLTLKVALPSSTVTYETADLTKDAVGEYHKDITAPSVSSTTRVWYKFISTGTATGRKEAYFTVKPSEID
jgi:hypothetical protein